MEYLNILYVIQSVSVGIKAKPHFATLDCHVATSLLLAMTNGKLTSNLPFAHKVRFTKQIILRNCGLSFCPSYFDSKDSLRG